MKLGKLTLRVLQLKRMLDLVSCVEIPGVLPRSMEIKGNRMDMASSVMLNDATADKFAALGADRLLVQVPPGVTGPIYSVAVFSDYIDPGGSSLAFYDFGAHPWFTEGQYRLLQLFIKLLLTSPGTDVFSLNSGGGLQKLLVNNVDAGAGNALSGEIESRVGNVTSQIIQNQSLDPTIPQRERLLNASVDGITFSVPEQAVNVRISLHFHDGGKLTAGFGW